MNINVYKFRSLSNDSDLKRICEILTTWNFYCSSFDNFNDPMEGSFLAKEELINEIYTEKNNYKICSFSGEDWFKNPAMRWYYANAFKWIAIRIEISENDIYKIQYNKKITEHTTLVKILTTKNKARIHEDEYRFLTEWTDNKYVIWKIKEVIIGNPYGYITNQDNYEWIVKWNSKLKEYEIYRVIIEKLTKWLNFECSYTSIVNWIVEKEIQR